MVLILHPKKPPSNKPPLGQPPDAKLFTSYVQLPGGKVVWRSYPQPDKLTLRGYLTDDHFNDPVADNLHQRVQSFVDQVGGYYSALTEKGPFKGSGKTRLDVMLPLGERGSGVRVLVTREKSNDDFVYKMALEMNPRKLGPAGCNQLQKGLIQAGEGGPFKLGLFLADAWVNRIDVAIDFADVVPSDLILTATKSGKRMEIFGDDGALETVQVHRTKPPPKVPKKSIKKPLGTLIAKLYDRNRERIAHGNPPPYEGRQVTRLEVKKEPHKTSFGLLELAEMGDPFAAVRLSWAASLLTGPHQKAWLTYVAGRRALGKERVNSALAKWPLIAPSANSLFEKHPSNLLADANWQDWLVGLKKTGLGDLIDLAIASQST